MPKVPDEATTRALEVVEEASAKKKRRQPKRRGKQGYVHKTNAINMTVYDAHGKPLPREFVEELTELVNQKAMDAGYWFMFTQT